MDILVLGATGNTGTAVIEQLKQTDAKFGAMVRSASAAEKLGLTQNQVRVGNFDDKASMVEAMKGIKRIYVAMPAHPDNRLWIENVLEAVKEAGVEHMVKLSGMGAKKDAGSAIIRTHAETDELVEASGVTYTIVQPNSFFQNLYGSLETINGMGQFFLPLADAKQSVVDIRDVAAVITAALTQDGHENQTYLLSGPNSLTFAEQAEIISKASGKKVEYVAVSQQQAAEAMKGAGMGEWLADNLAEIMAWFGEGHYAYTTDTVEKVTGKKPRTFADFAAEFAHSVQ
ncbi:hypothetical protein JCM19232_3312 [Vibrio ishigakensis]|uniref:NmrA-like domain-containing protein n=1 Tax=Vibrio ishigakensis TaxID=1481914 RepID=A0A0B8PCE3_9VIBR|nr:hypothetical protein JCM19232_3312 [Vibrio ishigakensis]